MLTLILATHNENKRKEMAAMLQNLPIHVLSLNDYPDIGEIVEDGKTFAENAAIKAQTVANLTGQLALADNSGLEVDALDGAPGIYSARFAGLDHDDAANNALLLKKMAAVPQKSGKRILPVSWPWPYQMKSRFLFEVSWTGLFFTRLLAVAALATIPCFLYRPI